MAQVTITINSREYEVACEDGQEVRILQLARMLDEKAKMLNTASGQVNECMLLAMIGLLLADELSELKKGKSAVASNNNPQGNFEQIQALDDDIAGKINLLVKELNSVASKINLL